VDGYVGFYTPPLPARLIRKAKALLTKPGIT
jgi:hypothetical protein